MISLFSILAVTAATAFAVEYTNPPVTSVFYNTAPYCNERCPRGFEYVESVDKCFKLLLDLGPVSQDRAVISCALNNGSTIPTFANMEEIQNVREYFYEKYATELDGSLAYTPQAGFWTGWVRQAGDGVVSDDKFIKEYVNMYSGVPMPDGLWAKGQPNDDNLDQSCVARKRFYKEFVQKKEADNGLDDYQCSYPHWVICTHNNVYALNKRAYNTAIMKEPDLYTGGECTLDWPTQTAFQFEWMIADAEANQAHKEVAAYQACQTPITASFPRFEEICEPQFNYKCV